MKSVLDGVQEGDEVGLLEHEADALPPEFGVVLQLPHLARVELGLTAALSELAERTRITGLDCTFAFEGPETALDHETTLHLYQIAQEAVANALRHGAPHRIDVRLTVRASTVALDVRDDGAGLPGTYAAGLGLRTMQQRAARLGGVLRVRPVSEGGTVVSCVVPRDPDS